MKKAIVGSLLVVLSLGCKTTKNNIQGSDIPRPPIQLRDAYLVSKIDSIRNVYVIYAENKSGSYKIVSLKDSAVNCKRIRVSDEVAFNLISLVQNETMNANHVSGIMFHGVAISLQDAPLGKIHIAINLKGLCIN